LYLTGFLVVYLLVVYRIKSENLQYTTKTISDFFLWAILGSLIGGRLGYVLLYNFRFFCTHPLKVFLPLECSSGIDYTGISGLSYHGSVIGILFASIFFCYKRRINFWQLNDLALSVTPLGYTLGRLGNFINGELYGRVTTSPLGMYFPLDTTNQLRHPSQLYEAFFEGLLLFVILWNLRKKKYFDGFISSIYLIGYGVVRFFIEFVREPDPQLGLILGYFTMGQILCLCMILSGLLIMLIIRKSYRIGV
jgi:phosphatidylglycerol:prolipoprotein diacylglycerol transferase